MNEKISGESVFLDKGSKNFRLLKEDFNSLDKSIIWRLNDFFWKHSNLWKKTFNEHFEASLPSHISESHREEFIEKSLNRFINLIKKLDIKDQIIVLEEGPGSGIYAQRFLDTIKEKHPEIYQKLLYLLSDTSEEIISDVLKKLEIHKDHLDIYSDKYKGKVVFIRMGNVWDQLKSRIFKLKDNEIYEVQTRDVINEEVNITFDTDNIEEWVLNNPSLWKDVIRAIKLEKRDIKIEEDFKYIEILKKILPKSNEGEEIIFNFEVLEDLENLLNILDTNNHGYIEIIDIFSDTTPKSEFPKKYDGAIGMYVNSLMIKEFLDLNNFSYRFEQLRGLNKILTIRNNSFENLLFSNEFLILAEIAVKNTEDNTTISKKIIDLQEYGVDIITFSDQANLNPDLLKSQELYDRGVFSLINSNKEIVIVKTRDKTIEEINFLCSNIKSIGINNIFLVTGDPNPNIKNDKLLKAMEVMPKLKDKFFIGSVTQPKIEEIDFIENKINDGARFLIAQACFDDGKFKEWVLEIKRRGIHNKIYIFPTIIPILSKNALNIVKNIPGVLFSNSFETKFNNLDDEAIRTNGIDMAKEQIEYIKTEDIFSGVYIYSKSIQAIKDILTTNPT